MNRHPSEQGHNMQRGGYGYADESGLERAYGSSRSASGRGFIQVREGGFSQGPGDFGRQAYSGGMSRAPGGPQSHGARGSFGNVVGSGEGTQSFGSSCSNFRKSYDRDFQDWNQRAFQQPGRSAISGAGPDQSSYRPERGGMRGGDFGYAPAPSPGIGQDLQRRGPKGYKRSDARIHEDICDRLTGHGGVDAGDVEVQVSEGVVTLQGTVGRREAKRLIEDIAESVPGVKEVLNQIRLARSDRPQAPGPQGARVETDQADEARFASNQN